MNALSPLDLVIYSYTHVLYSDACDTALTFSWYVDTSSQNQPNSYQTYFIGHFVKRVKQKPNNARTYMLLYGMDVSGSFDTSTIGQYSFDLAKIKTSDCI